MRWTGWSEVSEADVRIGANIDKVLLGGKPVMGSHHGRSTPGGKTFVAQRLDKVEDTVVPDTGIGIGSVMDEVLPRGGETCADQQPDKAVGSTPMGDRHYKHTCKRNRVITWLSGM